MNKKVLPIGLDIGHSSIKMVQLVLTDDGAKVLAAERASLPPHADEDDQTHQRLVTGTIKQLLTRGDFKGREVVSALPNERLRITSLRLSEAEACREEKTLQNQAAQRFGLDPRSDTIHHVLAGSVRQGDEAKNEYILLATDNETITSHISLLERAGLKLAGIDAVPCALFRNFERMMRRQEDKERTLMFIDVGHRYTTVVIGRAGEICFVKQMAFGVARFSEDIAAQLDISAADADALRLKRDGDTSVEASTQRLVADALAATGEQLAAEISLCLRYYSVTFRGRRIERALVTGGGAHEPAVLDVLRQRLAIETEVAEPLRGFDSSGIGCDEDRQRSLAEFALAVGLSLKGWGTSATRSREDEMASEPVLEGEPS
ncbi:MAG: pilus assembly protein PilM [Sedimentisphaerales bacterium]|nr:pilus assembly protein PilM [Sedimentisphaerales bacterium]